MKFRPTKLGGVFEVTVAPHLDERGVFARVYCSEEFAAAGITFEPKQMNLSTNVRRHTLRGLHYQNPPHAEAKFVRCIAGRVWDVVVDLRPGPDYLRWIALELDAGLMNAVFLPEGVAHGFLTMTDGAEILYLMGGSHTPGQAHGLHWSDPALGIRWPAAPAVISKADSSWPRIE